MMDYSQEYTISEVSELTGYAPHVLRYYEKEFEIEVPRTDSNHRYYTYKEIELIQYIKMLQEKGFSNKQIKLIISSPELVISGQNNNSLSVVDNSLAEIDSSAIALEISKSLEEVFFTKLNDIISQSNKDSISIIEELRDEIIELKQEINSKERDVLICENAKLKMNLKEKTYEVIELREKIRRYEENQVGFFKRLFGISNVK
ncbi:MerR family transcriptional regulator [Paratissierella segnis]|jgi:DNA-binding transcriptional MerR regulator|uniref:MerR family transcriptional regulator n=1 Tax=Paratissierella segnis TaxID=2763679 RepID=A0A926EVV0_9FIRM|nr:helix-turn-helix domain-containing protein [Paratissierella segnis]MBC8589238.1 MerR family transcriptional regulator [Paratissierella segnis]